jgi:hypothetical protein
MLLWCAVLCCARPRVEHEVCDKPECVARNDKLVELGSEASVPHGLRRVPLTICCCAAVAQQGRLREQLSTVEAAIEPVKVRRSVLA